MNKSIRFRIYVAPALLCLTLFASCSADDGTELPEGKYPMTFATAMEGLTQTRATTDNTWKGDEKIAVQVGSEVKQYKPESGQTGKLTGADADNTFYWQKTDETKNVCAWYCGNGSTTTRQANAAQLPTTWSVQANQSGNGYAKSDFLYATPQDIAYSDRDNGQLTFNHLPAKVVVHLKSGDGLTEKDVTNAVVRFVSQAITSGKINGTDGTVAQTTGNKEITPNVSAPLEAGYQQSVQALLVPQQMKDKKFIKVTVGTGDAARDYYYTPTEATEANLENGKQYAYEITVMKTGLSVAPVTVGGWTDKPISGTDVDKATFRVKFTGGPLLKVPTLNGIQATAIGNVYETTGSSSFSFSYIASNRSEVPAFAIEKGMATGTWTETPNGNGTTTYTYTCTNIRSDLWIKNLEAGYYYYADGTWSSEYTAGEPACIGIVFWVGDATVKDDTLKNDHPYCTHGLVVALNDVKDGTVAWQDPTSSVQSWLDNNRKDVYLSVASGPGIDDPLNNIQGYNNTKAIEDFNAYAANSGKLVQAVSKVVDYRTTVSVPRNSSGWYLPSEKELTLLCGRDADNIAGSKVGTANRDLINVKLSLISSGATAISSDYYWSSAEYNNSRYYAFNVDFFNGYVGNYNKDNLYRVRCILAF